MKFELDYVFSGVSLPDFVELYYDREANEAMARDVKLVREYISFAEENGVITQEVRTAPERQLPSVLKKVIRTERIEYLEKSTYTRATGRGTWKTIPNVLPGKVVTEGWFELTAAGDNRVRRRVGGEITIKVALVGGTIEKLVINNVKESIQKYNDFMQRWIDEH